jgi:hypothetical protein
MDIDTTVDCDNNNPLPNLPNNYDDILDMFFEYISPERDSIVEKLWNENAKVRYIYTRTNDEKVFTVGMIETSTKYEMNMVDFLNRLNKMPTGAPRDGRIVVYSVGDTDNLMEVPFNNYSGEPVASFGEMLKPFIARRNHDNRKLLDELVREYKNSVCLYSKVLKKLYEDNTIIHKNQLDNFVIHLFIANRIKTIYVSLMYRLIQMYEIQKDAFRQANSTSYLSQLEQSRQIGDEVAITGNQLNQTSSNFIGVNTKEEFENMDQEAVYNRQFETVVPKSDESLMAELNNALTAEYTQQQEVPLALPKSTSIEDIKNTGREIIVQDVIKKKNLGEKLVELRNQVEYLQRVNRVVYYRKLAMYLFIAIVLCIMMYLILR